MVQALNTGTIGTLCGISWDSGTWEDSRIQALCNGIFETCLGYL